MSTNSHVKNIFLYIMRAEIKISQKHIIIEIYSFIYIYIYIINNIVTDTTVYTLLDEL